MGLFGGFKAKFTGGNSSNKKKPQEVVCLKYHIHSEFDAQDSLKPLPVNNEKKNEAVRSQSKKKSRNAVTKSAIFPEDSSQSSSFSSTPQKSLSLTNLTNGADHRHENGHASPITVSTTFNLPSNGTGIAVSDTEYRKTTEEHNGVVTEKVAVVTNNHLYTTDRNVKKEEHSQSILKKVSTYDEYGALTNGVEHTSNAYIKPSSSQKENGLADQSTLIFMTQHSSRNSSFDKTTEKDDLIFTNGASHSNHHNSYDDEIDYFKTKSSRFDKNTDNDDLIFTNGASRSNDHNASDDEVDYFKIKNSNFNKNMVNDDFIFTKGTTHSNNTTDGNFNIDFPPNNSSDDEPDYFKINVVKYDLNRTYSQSEDEQEQSHVEEEVPRFTRMGYSSQAASIFFGEGDEIEVARPRKIQLTEDDDDRRSSGADC